MSTDPYRQLIILFLDIDGVLLPFPCHERSSCGALFPDRTLSALSWLLEESQKLTATSCSSLESSSFETVIVLSSTWRVQESFRNQILDSFRAYAYQYGGPLMEMDDFYDITDPDIHSERQHEIAEWLVKNQGFEGESRRSATTHRIAGWLALDDEELLLGDVNRARRHVFEGHVIQPKSNVGLTLKQAERGLELLRKQLEDASKI